MADQVSGSWSLSKRLRARCAAAARPFICDDRGPNLIPFLDLKAQYSSIKSEVDVAIQGVLNTCQFILGSEVAAFEQEFASYCGSEHGVGVNSGTSALHLALLAAGIGPSDEV